MGERFSNFVEGVVDYSSTHRRGYLRDKIEQGFIHFLGKDSVTIDDGPQETIDQASGTEIEQ